LTIIPDLIVVTKRSRPSSSSHLADPSSLFFRLEDWQAGNGGANEDAFYPDKFVFCVHIIECQVG